MIDMSIGRKLIVCLIFLLLGVRVFADGTYFPERAIRTIPSARFAARTY